MKYYSRNAEFSEINGPMGQMKWRVSSAFGLYSADMVKENFCSVSAAINIDQNYLMKDLSSKTLEYNSYLVVSPSLVRYKYSAEISNFSPPTFNVDAKHVCKRAMRWI